MYEVCVCVYMSALTHACVRFIEDGVGGVLTSVCCVSSSMNFPIPNALFTSEMWQHSPLYNRTDMG